MSPLLLLLISLLPLGAETEEIIGGHEVKPHSRPYMAIVQSQSEESTNICGGFLVQEDFVLTAAHCWGSSMNVTLGAHSRMKREPTKQVIDVKKPILHSGYKPKSFSNDIMLLKLKTKAKLTTAVQPLKLPSGNSRVRPGEVCHLAGWGMMSAPKGNLASVLQEVELVVQEDLKCKKHIRKYKKIINICAGDPKKPQSSFNGDSGGPLVCKNEAYGILSFGKRDGTPPKAFTNVPYFLPWIRKHMKLS